MWGRCQGPSRQGGNLLSRGILTSDSGKWFLIQRLGIVSRGRTAIGSRKQVGQPRDRDPRGRVLRSGHGSMATVDHQALSIT